jgi:hypothetical protein
MMILLKHFLSNDRAAIDFDIRETDYGPNAQKKTVGFYSVLGNDRVGLFALEGKLFIFVNDDVGEVSNDTIDVRHSQRGTSCELELKINGRNYTVAYPSPLGPVSTQFYSEDEEDADFGLWLQSVLGSAERRKIILGQWSKGIN